MTNGAPRVAQSTMIGGLLVHIHVGAPIYTFLEDEWLAFLVLYGAHAAWENTGKYLWSHPKIQPHGTHTTCLEKY